jgi:shikimate kinase
MHALASQKNPRRAACSHGLRQAIVGNSQMIPEAQLEKPLRLALIGMSGSGKTFWTKLLAAAGLPVISCDDQIEQRLAPRLASGRHAGINGVAAWMGWPDSPTYSARESEYLAEEISALGEILSDLEKNPRRSLILDTSGSVIHTGNNLLIRLRRQMTIVYLAATPEEQQLLIQRYLDEPKPVLWRGAFHPRPGESPKQTVARCYPALIAARGQSYQALAHCTLSVAQLHAMPQEAEAFLEIVRRELK